MRTFKILYVCSMAVVLGGISSATADELVPFRPPAVPLVTVDPYTSVWSFTDNLYDSWPVHWTGAVRALSGIMRADGKAYRFMGPEAICPTAARQTSLLVGPTRTTYKFEAGGIELELTSTVPMLPYDLGLLSCPVAFLSYQLRSIDGRKHSDVALYFDASAEWVVNEASQKVLWQRMPQKVADIELVRFGSTEQPILAKAGDDLRIDWGYFYVGLPVHDGSRSVVAAADDARKGFVQRGPLPEIDDRNMPRPANQDWPVIACEMNIGTVQENPVQRLLVLAYDDIFSIEYMQQKLRPWWFKEYGGFNEMFETCVRSYDEICTKCAAFDKELLADARRLGGEEYSRIVSLAYRQTVASGKVVAGPDNLPWFMHKECFSNGCMSTVDVSYPASPFFALFSPTLLNGMISPIFDYAASGKWPHPFAPHDIGTYPKGNGQVYSGTRLEGQMPVEESGNMILMAAAGAKATGNARFAAKHWTLLTRWAEYLREKGLDPENQLCTDDFTGHLAHNANLSLKAINALGAYGMLCDMLGKRDDAAVYRNTVQDMAKKWVQMADDGDHYRLTFDGPNTWSMKYNLVWDKLLDLNLFPEAVAQKEVAYYFSKQNRYGLPLDHRADFTKSDWLVWSASLANSKEDFEKLIEPLSRFLQESPSRVPFSDWYFTSTGKVRGFRARPVIGGVFIRFLSDKQLWRKWSSRDRGYQLQ
jgi:hypothetical protein